jgi:hypothetical protein
MHVQVKEYIVKEKVVVKKVPVFVPVPVSDLAVMRFGSPPGSNH